jgi:hypothetical protein
MLRHDLQQRLKNGIEMPHPITVVEHINEFYGRVRAEITMLKEHLEVCGYHLAAGEYEPWSRVLADLMAHFEARGATYWTRTRIKHELARLDCPIGRGSRGVWSVGNISRKFTAPRRWVATAPDKIALEQPKTAA